MRQSTWWRYVRSGLLLCACVMASAHLGRAQETTIFAELVPLQKGGGLSVRTAVTRPGTIKGIRSWTIETRRHRWAPTDMALSPTGTLVATSGYDGMVRLWDPATGKLVRVLVGHDSYSYGLSWSPDGQYLASAGTFDYTVRVWEASTGLPVKVLRGLEGPPTHTAWSPDGVFLAAGTSGSGYLSIWRIATSAQVKPISNGKAVTALVFSPDSQTLACGVSQVGVNFVSSTTGKSTDKMDLIGQDPRSLAYLAEGKKLVVSAAKATVIYDVAEKKAAREIEGSAIVAQHGNRLAVVYPTGRFVDLESGKASGVLPTGNAVSWSRDGKTLCVLSGDDVVRVDPEDGKEVKRWKVASSGTVWWSQGRPIVTGIGTLKPQLWDQATGKLAHTLEGHKATTTTLAWSPGGKVLATGGHDKTVRVWDPQTGKLMRTLEGFEGAVTALAVAGDGKIAAADKSIRVFSLEGTQPTKTFAGHTEAVRTLAWSKDGRLASGGLEATVHIWGMDSDKPLRSLPHAGSVESLAFAPNGKMLAAGANSHHIHVWVYPGNKLLNEFAMQGSPPQVSALAWSPDSTSLLAGRANHTIQLWDLKSAKDRHNFNVMAPVQSVTWAAGGKVMVSCTLDRSVRFWHPGTGRLQTTVFAEDEQLSCVTSDGYYRAANESDTELVFVVLTMKSMDSYSPKEFTAKFNWKNDATKARLTGN